MSSSGPCALCPGPWSPIGIYNRIVDLVGLLLVLCAFHRWSGSLWAHEWYETVWRSCGEGYAAYNILLHDWFGGASVTVWGGTHRLLQARQQQLRPILEAIVRVYTCPVGSGFLHNAWPLVMRLCRQFLDKEFISAASFFTLIFEISLNSALCGLIISFPSDDAASFHS